MIKLTFTLKMTTPQVVERSVTVNNNSPIQDYVDPDDHIQPTYEMTPGFKPFTVLELFIKYVITAIEKKSTVRNTFTSISMFLEHSQS